MNGAAIGGDRSPPGVLGGHRYGEWLAGGGAGRRRQLQVVHDRRAEQEGIQKVRGRLLDARVRLDTGAVVIQAPAPGHGPCRKDPGATRSLVDGRVRVVGQTAGVGVGGVREQRSIGRIRRRVIRHVAVHFVADDAGHRIAVVETGARVDPVRAVGHHIGDVAPISHLGGVLDAHQGLFRTVHWCAAAEYGRRRPLYWIDARALVADQHPVGDAGGGGLVTDLPVHVVGAKEGQVHARVAGILGRVVHLIGPVLVVAGREKGLVVEQVPTIGMGIDVGRVGHVVAVVLQPADELDIPAEDEAGAVVGEGSVKRYLDGTPGPGHRVGPVAVVLVQTLAGQLVVWVVVVSLGRVDALLVEEGRRPAVTDDEDHEILVAGGIREHRQIDTAGPIAGNGQAVAGRPAAGDQTGGGIRRASGLRTAVKRTGVEAQAAAPPAIPTDAVEINGVGLGRVDGDVEREVAALEHAGGRAIPLDLPVHVVPGFRQLPGRGAGLLILCDDGIGRRHHWRRWGGYRGCQQAQ